jgi:hypothetical protein
MGKFEEWWEANEALMTEAGYSTKDIAQAAWSAYMVYAAEVREQGYSTVFHVRPKRPIDFIPVNYIDRTGKPEECGELM